MLLRENIFKNIDNTPVTSECIYYIGSKLGNTKLVLCYDTKTKKIYSSADEWLHLIQIYYTTVPGHPYYTDLVNVYNHAINNNNVNTTFAKDQIIPFITSFSTGTVHGYAGLFYIINNFLNKVNDYKDHKIAIFNGSDKGILEIINHLIIKGVIQNEIIILADHTQYKFKSIKFIKNEWHVYPKNLNLTLLEKYFISNTHIAPKNRICIIKNTMSDNKTSDGVVNKSALLTFCHKNKFLHLEPSITDEISLINFLYRCSLLVISWGTAFFKNYIYVSEKCTQIIVLVIGPNFINQYNDHFKTNNLVTKYKNATVSYYISDTNLNIDLSKHLKVFN